MPVSEAEESANFEVLAAFRSRWDQCPGWRPNRIAGFSVFPALIKFYGLGEVVSEVAQAKLFSHSGPGDGRIDLQGTKFITDENYHTYFLPNAQNYWLDDDTGVLMIAGESKKMTGAFDVEIKPLL